VRALAIDPQLATLRWVGEVLAHFELRLNLMHQGKSQPITRCLFKVRVKCHVTSAVAHAAYGTLSSNSGEAPRTDSREHSRGVVKAGE
jgi:hypothetical protein